MTSSLGTPPTTSSFVIFGTPTTPQRMTSFLDSPLAKLATFFMSCHSDGELLGVMCLLSSDFPPGSTQFSTSAGTPLHLAHLSKQPKK